MAMWSQPPVPSATAANTWTLKPEATTSAPATMRFTQEDAHWNTANMIYGDNPIKIQAGVKNLLLCATDNGSHAERAPVCLLHTESC